MADQGMLARLLAGIIGPGAQKPEPNFAPSPSPFNVPYTGLRNEPAPPQLPPFEQPGQMLAQYQPPLQQGGRQANYGPGPTPQPMPQAMPQQAQPWMALNDQNRTAAFDPTKDANDPNNVNMVDEFGRVTPMYGPFGPMPGSGSVF